MSTTAAGRSAPTRPPADELVGRDRDLDAVRRLLADHRLVTVTGPGGVGKTRLARALVNEHPGDVAVCELAPVPSSAGVSSAVAEALGFPSLEAAAVGLSGHDRLLVVDNAEHHVDAVARAVGDLLAASPRLRGLVTSQQPLDVAGE